MSLHTPLMLLLLWSPAGSTALDPPDNAERCGRCHRTIFEAWKTSAHARSMESWLFQDALEMAESEFGPSVRKTCLQCHSPIGLASGDLKLQKKVSWDGVTCDYCHSIRDVSLEGSNPKAVVSFSAVKSGPLKDASSTAHATQYSPIHTSSIACAPCHEYKNHLGFSLLTTFSEWKASPYGKDGKQCQTCHMYQVAGDVVDPRIKRSREAKINLHAMPGSHSLDQLTKTITAQLSTSRTGQQLKVTVVIANRGAGHFVPTGSPLRQLILEVKADTSDGRHLREEKRYQRVVADQSGTPLAKEHAAFMKATKVLSDTRLAPDERRTESFSFAIPAGIQTRITANLRYYYSPMARSETQQEITFRRITRLVQ
ncbi:MAG: multiheme c-type cytochrome [Acidobacteriota bacterium]